MLIGRDQTGADIKVGSVSRGARIQRNRDN